LATPRQSLSTWRRSVLSGSWETCCVYALFFDPGRTSPPGHYGGSARPPRLPTAKAPTISQFRGSVAEPQHALFTLRRVCRHTRRKTRFRVPAQLSRTGLITRKVSRKVSELLPTSLPPFPGFPDAMANWQTQFFSDATSLPPSAYGGKWQMSLPTLANSLGKLANSTGGDVEPVKRCENRWPGGPVALLIAASPYKNSLYGFSATGPLLAMWPGHLALLLARGAGIGRCITPSTPPTCPAPRAP
jgi:hypothetical protein